MDEGKTYITSIVAHSADEAEKIFTTYLEYDDSKSYISIYDNVHCDYDIYQIED